LNNLNLYIVGKKLEHHEMFCDILLRFRDFIAQSIAQCVFFIIKPV